MKPSIRSSSVFILHPSSFILFGRRSQVVRQRSAKPLFIGSIPIAASNLLARPNNLLRGVRGSLPAHIKTDYLAKGAPTSTKHPAFPNFFVAGFLSRKLSCAQQPQLKVELRRLPKPLGLQPILRLAVLNISKQVTQ